MNALLALIATGFLFNSSALAHGLSEADKAKALEAGFLEYMELGARHMVTGYDHLLFLFGVIFFLTRFNEIIKFITAFTLGHSITLVFATLYHIQINYFLIDAVIALTVIYKGFDNIDGFKKYLGIKSPNLLFMVFAFGLIHGFGLSTRLQTLPLPDEGLISRILAFNIGVEVGQIIALSIMLALLSGWRKKPSFLRFSGAMNSLLIILGTLLLLMQLHGYQHSAHPDEFPINQDDHLHLHEGSNANAQKVEASQNSAAAKAKPKEPSAEKKPREHRHGNGKPHHH